MQQECVYAKSLLQNYVLNYIFYRILVSENVKWFYILYNRLLRMKYFPCSGLWLWNTGNL